MDEMYRYEVYVAGDIERILLIRLFEGVAKSID